MVESQRLTFLGVDWPRTQSEQGDLPLPALKEPPFSSNNFTFRSTGKGAPRWESLGETRCFEERPGFCIFYLLCRKALSQASLAVFGNVRGALCRGTVALHLALFRVDSCPTVSLGCGLCHVVWGVDLLQLVLTARRVCSAKSHERPRGEQPVLHAKQFDAFEALPRK